MKRIKQICQQKGFKFLVIVAIIIFFAFVVGYIAGTTATIKEVTKLAKPFININEAEVRAALFQYRNNIGGCYGKNQTAAV